MCHAPNLVCDIHVQESAAKLSGKCPMWKALGRHLTLSFWLQWAMFADLHGSRLQQSVTQSGRESTFTSGTNSRRADVCNLLWSPAACSHSYTVTFCYGHRPLLQMHKVPFGMYVRCFRFPPLFIHCVYTKHSEQVT